MVFAARSGGKISIRNRILPSNTTSETAAANKRTSRRDLTRMTIEHITYLPGQYHRAQLMIRGQHRAFSLNKKLNFKGFAQADLTFA